MYWALSRRTHRTNSLKFESYNITVKGLLIGFLLSCFFYKGNGQDETLSSQKGTFCDHFSYPSDNFWRHSDQNYLWTRASDKYRQQNQRSGQDHPFELYFSSATSGWKFKIKQVLRFFSEWESLYETPKSYHESLILLYNIQWCKLDR